MSTKNEFRFAYFTPQYDATVAFYRDGLELPLINSRDRGADDKGSVFAAASGLIEVLARPAEGKSSHLFDARPPQGAFMVIEIDNTEDAYARACAKGLWTLLTKVETSCDRILIAGGANVEAEWEQGPAV